MKAKSIIVVCLIAFTLIFSGCVSEEVPESTSEEVQESTQESYILDDYNRHTETWNEDMDGLNHAVDKWDTATSMATADGDITTEEINQIIDSTNEFIDTYNRISPHLVSFKEFIIDNEYVLKEAGIDTYQDKKDIDDLISDITQSIEDMKLYLEELIAVVETDEQYDEFGSVIETLGELALSTLI